VYQPILKGKKAEFDAWERVSPTRRVNTSPLFELVVKDGADADLRAFETRLAAASRQGDVVAVDLHALGPDAVPSGSTLRPYAWLATEVQQSGVKIRPVIYVDDDRDTTSDARHAAQLLGENVILRVGGRNGDPHPDVRDRSLAAFCASIGLATSGLHLLIDFEGIYGSNLGDLQRSANAYLAWVASNGSWASVTLAAGAFPAQITTLAKSTANMIPRLDAAVWNLVHPTSPVPDLQYGDYGIRHPELAEKGFGGPLPNLRYASETAWAVWREAKLQKYPNGSFYAVCAGIVSLPEFDGAQFSWADGVIATKATARPGPEKGSGTGADWITYGMNRHIEFVVDRLTNLHVA
jgi:hypothetical protein